MTKKYRKSGQIDVFEPVPSNDHSWFGWAAGIFIIVALLAQCSH